MPPRYQVKVTPATFPLYSFGMSPIINPWNTGELFIATDYFLFSEGFSNGSNNILVKNRQNNFSFATPTMPGKLVKI